MGLSPAAVDQHEGLGRARPGRLHNRFHSEEPLPRGMGGNNLPPPANHGSLSQQDTPLHSPRSGNSDITIRGNEAQDPGSALDREVHPSARAMSAPTPSIEAQRQHLQVYPSEDYTTIGRTPGSQASQSDLESPPPVFIDTGAEDFNSQQQELYGVSSASDHEQRSAIRAVPSGRSQEPGVRQYQIQHRNPYSGVTTPDNIQSPGINAARREEISLERDTTMGVESPFDEDINIAQVTESGEEDFGDDAELIGSGGYGSDNIGEVGRGFAAARDEESPESLTTVDAYDSTSLDEEPAEDVPFPYEDKITILNTQQILSLAMHDLKLSHKISRAAASDIRDLLESFVDGSCWDYRTTRKWIEIETGVKAVTYDCCKNSCMGYPMYADKGECDYCQNPRWKPGGKKIPFATYEYIPIIHRLRLWYADPARSSNLTSYRRKAESEGRYPYFH